MTATVLPQGSRQLFTAEQVEEAIAQQCVKVNAAYGDVESPVVVICVLTGGMVQCGIMLPKLNFEIELDYMHVGRYGYQTHGGVLEWLAKPRHVLSGRHVLLVDDIIDEGVTLHEIVKFCHAEGVASVRTAVLADKPARRKVPLQPDFVALEVPDEFVVGFGMDAAGLWRNAPGLFSIPS